MTTREHVYAVKNLLEKGLTTQSYTISLRLILHFLKIARQKLISEKLDKYNHLSSINYQSLCVELEPGSFHNCCEHPSVGCKLMKSKKRLPNMTSARWGDFFKVMTINGETVDSTSITKNKYAKYSITNTPASRGYFIHDDYLYIINDEFLELVLLNAIFEDPETIEDLNCKANPGAKCKEYLDDIFPIETDLVLPMYQLTLKIMEPALVLQQDPEKQTETQ